MSDQAEAGHRGQGVLEGSTGRKNLPQDNPAQQVTSTFLSG